MLGCHTTTDRDLRGRSANHDQIHVRHARFDDVGLPGGGSQAHRQLGRVRIGMDTHHFADDVALQCRHPDRATHQSDTDDCDLRGQRRRWRLTGYVGVSVQKDRSFASLQWQLTKTRQECDLLLPTAAHGYHEARNFI